MDDQVVESESDFDLAPDVPILPANHLDVPREEAPREPAPEVDLPRRELGFEFVDDLQDFSRAIHDRVDAERNLFENYGPAIDLQTEEFHRQLDTIRAERDAKTTEVESDYARDREELETTFDRRCSADRVQHEATLREIEQQYSHDAGELDSRLQDSAWVMSSVMDDSAENSPKRQFLRFETQQERIRDQQRGRGCRSPP